jgi:hypothetical protein
MKFLNKIRQFCPEPPNRFPSKLKHYSTPIAIVLAATLFSVSFLAISSNYLFGASAVKPVSVFAPLAQTSGLTNNQRAVEFLGDVVGLNMTVYKTDLTQDSNAATNSGLPMPENNVNLPKEILMYNLTGAQGSLRASVSFMNGSLNQIYLSDYVGVPSLNSPATNTPDMAQGFMQRYENYTGNQFYGTLSSMLNGVTLSTNLTKTVGNAKLQITATGNEQDLMWAYVDDNGVPANMKNVVLSFYNGRLESFVDNWQLYQIGGMPKLSSQDAINVVLQAVKSYSYTFNVTGTNETVSSFKVASTSEVSLSYLNYYEQTPQQSIRGGNPLILYPCWYVAVGFDKVYPGDVTGLIVNVWADNGNIGYEAPMAFDAPPPTTSALSNAATHAKTDQMPIPILLPVIAATVSSMVGLYLFMNRNKNEPIERR